MADPLSITVSIIAIIGAAEGVTKIIGKIKHLQNAPTNVLALLNEIADLTVVLKSVQTVIQSRNTQSFDIPREQLQQLSTLVHRAKDEIFQLESLIEHILVKPDPTPNRIKVSCREWLKAKPKITEFQQNLRDIRLNIITHITLVNSLYHSHIGLVIDDIRTISGLIQADQRVIRDTISQYINAQVELLSNIKGGRAELQRLLELESPSSRSYTSYHNEPYNTHAVSNRIIRVQARIHEKASCNPFCSCACHVTKTFQTPRFLCQVMGTLFIGYYGQRFLARKPCTASDCLGSSMVHGSIQYFFPRRMWARAVSASILMNTYNEIKASLTVTRIIARGAEIFRLEQAGDIDGMKRLFSLGLASPLDASEDGFTLLRFAISSRRVESCRFLLQAGADPQMTLASSEGNAFDLAWRTIFQASANQNILQTFRELFPDDDGHLDKYHFSPLHKSILGLSSQSLEEVVSRYADDLDSLDSLGNTALIWASQQNNIEAIYKLVNAGANINIRNSVGSSALYYAAYYCALPCLRLLVCAGSDPSSLNFYGENALHALCGPDSRSLSEHRAMVLYLVTAGCHVDRRDNWGATPLAFAARYNLSVAAAALLDCGADINSRDNDGDCAVQAAVHFNNEEVLRLLLSRGANYTTWISSGNSIIHQAAIGGSLNTIDIMLSARLKDIDPDAKNHQGYTALELAQQREIKPDGFMHKLQSLLADVRSRNVHTATGINDDDNDDANNLSINGVRNVLFQSPRDSVRAQVQDHYLGQRFIQRLHLLLHQLEGNIPRRLGFVTSGWKTFYAQLRSILLMRTLVLGLCFALLILCVYPISHLQWVRLALEMVWNLIGPGDLEL